MSGYRKGLEAIAKRSIEELKKGVVPRHVGQAKPETGVEKSSEAKENRGTGQKVEGVAQGSLFSEVSDMPKSVRSSAMTSQEAQVLERVLWFPDETIQERCKALRIDRGKEWRARQRLVLQGLLAVAGKIGKWEFFGPTEIGKEWAAEHGMQEKKFKSGLLHEILLKKVEMAISGQVPGVVARKGGQLEGVQFDLLVNEKGEETSKVPVQVSVSNTAKYEIERARRLGRHPCVAGVVIVGVARKKVRVLEAELQRRKDEMDSKVIVLAGEDVMSGKIGWKGIVKGARKAAHEGHVRFDVYEDREGERKA